MTNKSNLFKQSNKIWILGIIIIIFGLDVAYTGVSNYAGGQVYIGDNHGEVGILFIVVGIFIVFYGFSTEGKRSKATQEFNDKVFICPKCEKPYPKKEIQDLICPVCKIEVEELEGFFRE